MEPDRVSTDGFAGADPHVFRQAGGLAAAPKGRPDAVSYGSPVIHCLFEVVSCLCSFALFQQESVELHRAQQSQVYGQMGGDCAF